MHQVVWKNDKDVPPDSLLPEQTAPARLPAHCRAGAETFLVLGAEDLAVETPGICETEVAFFLADRLPAEGTCHLFPVTHVGSCHAHRLHFTLSCCSWCSGTGRFLSSGWPMPRTHSTFICSGRDSAPASRNQCNGFSSSSSPLRLSDFTLLSGDLPSRMFRTSLLCIIRMSWWLMLAHIGWVSMKLRAS